MGILSDTLDAVTLGLLHPSSAGPAPVTNDDLVPLVQLVGFDARVVDDVFDEADGLGAVGVTVATDAGAQLEKTAHDFKFATEHTYKTVIPGSLRWLEGDMVLHIIDPLRKRVGKVEDAVKALQQWRTVTQKWRTSYVDPTLHQYLSFRKFFDGWPTDVLGVVHGWLTHPVTFADYVTPLVARPLVNYWSSNDHRPLLDDLVTIVIDASPDRYRHAVAAFELMLDQDWP